MDLVSPRTYLAVAAFKAQPNDYPLTSYSDPNLQDLLVRSSGVIDAYLRRTLMATEVRERFSGEYGNTLFLGRSPICYVKSITLITPGMPGSQVPLSQVLIDYERGEASNWTPLVFQGVGLSSVFPRGLPLDVVYAYGYNYAVAAPTWLAADVPPLGPIVLSPGTYYAAVTSVTQWGESSATLTAVSTSSGAIAFTIAPVLGAYAYNVYLGTTNSPAAAKLVGQSTSVNYGNTAVTLTIQSLAVPLGTYPQSLPTVDTTARPYPSALIEATRLVALGILWEQNNLANRGIQGQRSGDKDLRWRSTEGSSGRGVSYVTQQVQELLAPYKLQSIS